MTSDNLLLAVVNIAQGTTLAVDRCADIAGKLDATIELFASCYDEHIAGTRFFDSPDLAAARDRLVAAAVETLEGLAAPLRERGLSVETYACWGRPEHEAVVRRATQRKAHMVLHDCEYHSAISRAIFSHEDWQLIRACPCPLLLVKEHHDYHAAPRVWAAVDPLQRHDKPASLDKEILFLARGLSESLGGELDVVHSYDPAAALAAAAAPAMVPEPLPLEKITEEMRDHHQRYLLRLTDRFDIPHDRVHNLAGSAREVLSSVATDHKIDILVMGAVSRSGLNRLILGSTAEKVIDHVPCDVLVVKPKSLYSTTGDEVKNNERERSVA